MKIRVSLKDPDGFSNSVDEAVKDDVCKIPNLDPEEIEAITEVRCEKVWDALSRFVEYQEYIMIVFDTEAGTATVEERNRR